MIIDAHHHLWNYDPLWHQWIDESMIALRKDFDGEQLHQLLLQHGVTGTVLVQVEQSEQKTEWLVEQGNSYPYIRGIVGWVDLCAPDIGERLNYFQQFGKLKGFRHILQDEGDPYFMLADSFQNGITQLELNGYTFDLLIYPHQMSVACKLVKAFPQQRFVLDHMAKPRIEQGEIDEWARSMEELAACSNLSCKISGLITEADHGSWTYDQLAPYLQVAYDLFGSRRLLFGSDWPVCLLAGRYGQVLDVVKKFLSGMKSPVREQILYSNAENFYNL